MKHNREIRDLFGAVDIVAKAKSRSRLEGYKERRRYVTTNLERKLSRKKITTKTEKLSIGLREDT